jgi:hypothetical protein
MDLGQMPWGPFDALGKRLSLLLPAANPPEPKGSSGESQVERALRHVEHASDRCAEFSQLAGENQELWRRSHETWEWIRKYLTSLWADVEVDGRREAPKFQDPPPDPAPKANPPEVPTLPGAAATLRVAAKALRATPLATWRETIHLSDPEAPTREEAVQTLLGVARILGGESQGGMSGPVKEQTEPVEEQAEPVEERVRRAEEQATPVEEPDTPTASGEVDATPEDESVNGGEQDPDQLSFDFAQGYDEGYQMGRRVGLALGARKRPR